MHSVTPRASRKGVQPQSFGSAPPGKWAIGEWPGGAIPVAEGTESTNMFHEGITCCMSAHAFTAGQARLALPLLAGRCMLRTCNGVTAIEHCAATASVTHLGCLISLDNLLCRGCLLGWCLLGGWGLLCWCWFWCCLSHCCGLHLLHVHASARYSRNQMPMGLFSKLLIKPSDHCSGLHNMQYLQLQVKRELDRGLNMGTLSSSGHRQQDIDE